MAWLLALLAFWFLPFHSSVLIRKAKIPTRWSRQATASVFDNSNDNDSFEKFPSVTALTYLPVLSPT